MALLRALDGPAQPTRGQAQIAVRVIDETARWVIFDGAKLSNDAVALKLGLPDRRKQWSRLRSLFERICQLRPCGQKFEGEEEERLLLGVSHDLAKELFHDFRRDRFAMLEALHLGYRGDISLFNRAQDAFGVGPHASLSVGVYARLQHRRGQHRACHAAEMLEGLGDS